MVKHWPSRISPHENGEPPRIARVIAEISVRELADRRDRGDDPFLLDVRDEGELAVASLPGVVHIPMAEIAGRLAELPREREIVVLCHLGGRSERVTRFLRVSGFPLAVNLAGGIDAWSREIDPAIPRY
jgi:rhodanese-related sulfurtransferase